MAGSDGIPQPVKDSERRMMSLLPDRPGWLIVLLLLPYRQLLSPLR